MLELQVRPEAAASLTLMAVMSLGISACSGQYGKEAQDAASTAASAPATPIVFKGTVINGKDKRGIEVGVITYKGPENKGKPMNPQWIGNGYFNVQTAGTVPPCTPEQIASKQ